MQLVIISKHEVNVNTLASLKQDNFFLINKPSFHLSSCQLLISELVSMSMKLRESNVSMEDMLNADSRQANIEQSQC